MEDALGFTPKTTALAFLSISLSANVCSITSGTKLSPCLCLSLAWHYIVLSLLMGLALKSAVALWGSFRIVMDIICYHQNAASSEDEHGSCLEAHNNPTVHGRT